MTRASQGDTCHPKTALSCASVTDGINSKTVPFVDPSMIENFQSNR